MICAKFWLMLRSTAVISSPIEPELSMMKMTSTGRSSPITAWLSCSPQVVSTSTTRASGSSSCGRIGQRRRRRVGIGVAESARAASIIGRRHRRTSTRRRFRARRCAGPCCRPGTRSRRVRARCSSRGACRRRRSPRRSRRHRQAHAPNSEGTSRAWASLVLNTHAKLPRRRHAGRPMPGTNYSLGQYGSC